MNPVVNPRSGSTNYRITKMNPRRYSQIERALSILDKSGTVDILKENHYLLFLFKKTERITVALFIITGLIPDAEPLKWELRDAGVALIKDILSFKEHASVYTREFVSELLGSVARTLSLLDIGYIADLISPMNFSILQKELEGLLSIIDGKGRIGSIPLSPAFFDERFFGVSKELFFDTKEGKTEGAAGDPAIARKKETPPAGGENATVHSLGEFERLRRFIKDTHKGQDEIKDSVLYKKPVEMVQKTFQKPLSEPTRKPHKRHIARLVLDKIKEERKQIILALLRKKEHAMVKDFIGVIQDCSGKTIQRQLLELVHSGVLKKEGERRWSRYSLTQPV